MSRGDVLLFTVLPYVAIAIFVVGHWWRYTRDQIGWTSRSTQLLESRALRWGSVAFHLGALAAIGGHILGILVPASLTESVGIDDATYHVIAGVGGVTAGAAVSIGLLILIWRRLHYPRVRATTTRADVITFGLLALTILTGLAATLLNIVDEVAYRESVAPWFRGLLTLDPDPGLMAGINPLFGIHVSLAWLLFAFWPFSRLVHAWSVPLGYFHRRPVIYRSRTATAIRQRG